MAEISADATPGQHWTVHDGGALDQCDISGITHHMNIDPLPQTP
jgi:hypothetical protein